MSVRIIIGDCREKLKELPDKSVHCCVSSPPYFGLRDYGTAAWAGGDDSCDHKRQSSVSRASSGLGGSAETQGGAYAYGAECGKCGATRIDRQMGLEPTPDEFVAGMVEVFREVRRVLRDDGTLFVNIGDSYNAGRNGGHAGGPEQASLARHDGIERSGANVPGLKPKDLIGIPWMLAFALRADGWYLRQEIIWAKPNPMPESVRDRCTKAHEQIFLLSKSPRYFFDAEAIAEPFAESTVRIHSSPAVQPRAGQWKIDTTPKPGKTGGNDGLSNGPARLEAGNRNKRSVWTVTTQPYSEAHFATYPPALIEPCILAGCPSKCCAKCGAPWMREVEREVEFTSGSGKAGRQPKGKHDGAAQSESGSYDIRMGPAVRTTTKGFAPTCGCDAGTVAGTCIDPFGGAGTTGLVADRLGRNAILIELNPEYAEIAKRRLHSDAGMFAEVMAA